MFFIGRTYESHIRKILGNQHSFQNTMLTSTPSSTIASPKLYLLQGVTHSQQELTVSHSYQCGVNSTPSSLTEWDNCIEQWGSTLRNCGDEKSFSFYSNKESCGKVASAQVTECIGTFIFFLIACCLYSPTTQPWIHTAKDGSWIDLNGFCHIQKYYSSLPIKIFL